MRVAALVACLLLPVLVNSRRARQNRVGDQNTGDQVMQDMGLMMLAMSVPGRPGQDYPVFAAVPRTSFSCQDRTDGRYYGDQATGCQVYHTCGGRQVRGKLIKYSQLCPNGTIFDQGLQTCHWWYAVNCSGSSTLGVNNGRPTISLGSSGGFRGSSLGSSAFGGSRSSSSVFSGFSGSSLGSSGDGGSGENNGGPTTSLGSSGGFRGSSLGSSGVGGSRSSSSGSGGFSGFSLGASGVGGLSIGLNGSGGSPGLGGSTGSGGFSGSSLGSSAVGGSSSSSSGSGGFSGFSRGASQVGGSSIGSSGSGGSNGLGGSNGSGGSTGSAGFSVSTGSINGSSGLSGSIDSGGSSIFSGTSDFAGSSGSSGSNGSSSVSSSSSSSSFSSSSSSFIPRPFSPSIRFPDTISNNLKPVGNPVETEFGFQQAKFESLEKDIQLQGGNKVDGSSFASFPALQSIPGRGLSFRNGRFAVVQG